MTVSKNYESLRNAILTLTAYIVILIHDIVPKVWVVFKTLQLVILDYP